MTLLCVRLTFDNGADNRSVNRLDDDPATPFETSNLTRDFFNFFSPRAGLDLELEGLELPLRRLVRGAAAPVPIDMKLSCSMASAAAVASAEAPLAAAKRAFMSASFRFRLSRRVFDLVVVFSASAEWFSF